MLSGFQKILDGRFSSLPTSLWLGAVRVSIFTSSKWNPGPQGPLTQLYICSLHPLHNHIRPLQEIKQICIAEKEAWIRRVLRSMVQ